MGLLDQYARPAIMQYLQSMQDIPGLLSQRQQPPANWSDQDKLVYGLIQNYTPMGMATISHLYHGSPYQFSKFADEAIGTGEGAQARGFGHYLSDNRSVAKHYGRSNVRDYPSVVRYKGVPLEDTGLLPNTYFDRDVTAIQRVAGDSNNIYDIIRKFEKERMNLHGQHPNAVLDQYDRIINFLKKNKEHLSVDVGNMYQVTAFPNKQENLLKWDTMITDSDKKRIMDFANSNYGPDNPIGKQLIKIANRKGLATPQGSDLYREIERTLGGGVREAPRQTSDFLKKMGFDGIEYNAGTMSGVESNAKNYVIFDPNEIQIDKVNNIPIDVVKFRESYNMMTPEDKQKLADWASTNLKK